MLVDQFLSILVTEPTPLVLTLTTVIVKMPGDGGLLKFKRGDKGMPTPFVDGLYHLTRQHIILGGNYARMVNEQRQREFKAYLDSMPTPPKFVQSILTADEFIAEELWKGKGRRDELFPRFVVSHRDTGLRYLCFRPVSYDPSGQPTPLTDEFYEAVTLRRVDFDKEVKDYYRAVGKPPKGQMTKKMVPWRTVKLVNCVACRYKGTQYFLETELFDLPGLRDIIG
jgi:hypothetical protein